MVSFITPPPRGPAQVEQSSGPDRYEILMGDRAAAAKKPAPESRSRDSLPFPSVRTSTTSLGKRKADLAKDEVTGDSSIQQSPTRKKKRTLWDGSLSPNAEMDLVPPSTSSKRFNGRHIKAPPDAPSPQYGFAATPTPQTKATIIISKTVFKPNSAFTYPPPTACGHSIHPAYRDIYAKSMCPMCLMGASMNSLQSMQGRINDLGGLSEWQKNQNKYHCKIYEWMPTGGKKKKKKRPAYTDANGTDISYRHRKRNLLNLVTGLDTLSVIEVAWEEKQLPENSNVCIEQVRLRKQYSATAALHWYNDTIDNGFIGRIEDDCEFISGRYGRRWNIASEPEFPDGNRHTKELKWKTFTATQHKYFKSSKIPEIPKTIKSDTTDLQPTGKRRRENAGVSFNEDVYVRTDANVDVLRTAASSLLQDFLEEPASKKPRKSILRTAPLKQSEVSALTTPLEMDPTPTRPHHVIPLSRKDGPPRDGTKARMCREKSRYRRGQWAVPEGSELIDTSGRNREFGIHEAIVEGLRKEAARMDNKDLVEESEKPHHGALVAVF